MIVLFLTICAYFVYHQKIQLNATEVFYVIVAVLMHIRQYWFLVVMSYDQWEF